MPHFDSHIHLDALPDWPRVLTQGFAAQDSYHAFIPATGPDGVDALLAQALPSRIAFGAAIHPWYLPPDDETAEAMFSRVVAHAEDDRICAVGETGLDHYRFSESERPRVMRWFERHLELAHDVRKPVVVHCVRAYGDCLAALQRIRPERGGVLHAYSGSTELTREFQELGFYLAIGGAVTRARSTRVRRAACDIATDRLLVETDAPYLAVEGVARGDGIPSHIRQVCSEVAAIRGVSSAAVSKQTYANANRLFFSR